MQGFKLIAAVMSEPIVPDDQSHARVFTERGRALGHLVVLR